MKRKLYKITSAFGKFLALSDGNTIIQSDTEKPVVLYINEEKKKAYFLSEDSRKNINIGSVFLNSPIIQVDIHKEDNKYAFYVSNQKKFLSSHPDMTVHGNRDIVNDWERFSLSPYSGSEEAEKNVMDSVESIDMFLNNTKTYKQFLYEKNDEALLGIVANIFALSRQDLRELCLAFMDNEKWVSIIEKSFPEDIWASYAWKELHTWLSDRDSYSKRNTDGVVGREFDFLGCNGIPLSGRGLIANSPVEFLVRNMRENVEPRKDICVLATGRNEAVYYLEWVSYYRSIGVDGFFVYTNDNFDKSEDILQLLERNNILKYYRSESSDGVSVQWKAYAHALGMNPEILDYKWTLVCDIDEFLVINKNMFSNVSEYINFIERRDVDNIAIPWCYIGASNQEKWKDLPLMDRFKSKPFPERNIIKSIFRTHFAGNSHCHFPMEMDNYHMAYQDSSGVTITADVTEGYARAANSRPDYRMAVFYHYYFKSIEEFLWKSARNRGDYAKVSSITTQTFEEKLGDFYFDHYDIDHGDVMPMFPNIQDAKEDFLNEYELLMSIDGVEPLYAQIKKDFSEKISEVVRISKSEENYKTIPECYRKMVDIVDK